MKRLRVAHLLATLRIGGAERFCVDLASALCADGVESSIATLADGGPLEAVAQEMGITVHVGRRKFRRDPRPVLAAAKHLSALRPDVVHLHDLPGTILGAVAAGLAGITRIVGTRHDVRRLSWTRTLCLRTSEARVATVIASSEAVRRFLVVQQLRRRYPVIPCGIATRRFVYRDPPERACSHLLTVGRLVEQKGHRHLLETFRQIRERRPDARLTIVGDGPLRDALQRQARALGIDGVTRFLGFSLDTPALLDTADLFCFPSLWEPQGLAVLEAQAIGVPVIASAVDGITEAVEDGVTGRLVPPADPSAMAQAVLDLLPDREQRRRLAQTARARIMRWDIRGIAAEYANVYHAVVGRSTPVRALTS
jgi:glycosyltransferase involved in cell wall biosynthesis